MKRGDHLCVPHLLTEQLDVGMSRPERLAERRQRFETHAPAESQSQLTELSGACALRRGYRPIGLRKRSAGTVEQRSTRLGERHLSAGAHEQVCAQLLLQLPDRD